MTVRLLPRTRHLVACCAAAVAVALGAGSASAQSSSDTTASLLASRTDLASLTTALTAAGLVDSFTDCSAGPFTVLAPIDTAFVSAAGELRITVEALLADITLLGQVLPYHVVEGAFSVADLLEAGYLPTLHGGELEVLDDEDLTVIDGYATVLDADLETCNGVVHIIDAVLKPADFDSGFDESAVAGEALEIDEEGNVTAAAVDDGAKIPFLVLSVFVLGAGIGMVNVANRRKPS